MTARTLTGFIGPLLISMLAASSPCSAQTAVSPLVVTAQIKYPTDAPLRAAMVGVQNAVLAEHFAACAAWPTPKAYLTLADALDRQADSMRQSAVTGRSRVEVADLAARLNKSSASLRGRDGQESGVRQAVAVLVDYASDFRHPGWRPRRSLRTAQAVPGETASAESEQTAGPGGAVIAASAARRLMCQRLADGRRSGWPWTAP